MATRQPPVSATRAGPASTPGSARPWTPKAPSTTAASCSPAGRPGRRAEGTRRIYRLNPDGVTALRAYLDRVWEEALTAFAKATQATPVDPEQEDQ